jgi:plasmid stability protein
LRAQTTQHGQSTEAEVREILARAVKPATRIRIGDALAALAALGRKVGLTLADFELLKQRQDKTPAEPLGLERWLSIPM